MLSVTWDSGGPEICFNGQVELSVSITGGQPREVVLLRGEDRVATLTAPYKYTLDCNRFPEGLNSVVVKATTSSGQSFTSPEKSLRIDKTPPAIVGEDPRSTFPALGEHVVYSFSEPLHPLSLGSVQVTLRNADGGSVEHQLSLTEDGKGLRVVPTQPLVPPATLTAELIRADVMDLSGNQRQSHPGEFQPRSFTWWPFARVGEVPSNGYASFASQYAFSSNGHRVLAWAEYPNDPGVSELAVARRKGEVWERLPLLRTASNVGLHQSRVAVAVAEDGQIFLAWLEDDGTIHVKRFDGTGWQSVGSSPNPEGGSFFWLDMKVDTEGGLVVVWHDPENIHVARWEGSSWSRLGGPISANPDPHTSVFTPAIAVRPGLVVLAWSEPTTGSLTSLVHVWEHRNGAWSAISQPLKGDAGSTTYVGLALNAAWAPVLAWAEWHPDHDEAMIYFSQLTSRGDWATPESLQGWTKRSELSTPIVIVDRNGAPWVAWDRDSVLHAQDDVVYRRRGPNGWGPEQLVGGGYLVDFEVDKDGLPWVAVSSSGAPGLALTRPQEATP